MTAPEVTAVTGGTVVTPDGERRADVLIRDGKVAAIGAAGSAPGRRTDASGCYVLPGGVDPHCHLMPDVRRATAAAARGGTTTVLSFTNPGSGESDLDALLRCRAEVSDGRAVTDVGLHAMLYDPGHVSAASLASARRAGAGAIKVFLAYAELGIQCTTARLFELMRTARQLGLLVQVHCENGPLIDALTAGALAAGRSGARVFADTRPPEVEEEAVARVLAVASLAETACYLVHLSSAGALDQVRLARRRGRPRVLAEVCPHHLLLDDRCYAGAGAARYLVAPPLRPAAHLRAMWQGVADGTVDAVGSDHCQARTPVPGGLAPPGESYSYGLAAAAVRGPGAGCAGQPAGAAGGGEPGPCVRPLPGQGRACGRRGRGYHRVRPGRADGARPGRPRRRNRRQRVRRAPADRLHPARAAARPTDRRGRPAHRGRRRPLPAGRRPAR